MGFSDEPWQPLWIRFFQAKDVGIWRCFPTMPDYFAISLGRMFYSRERIYQVGILIPANLRQRQPVIGLIALIPTGGHLCLFIIYLRIGRREGVDCE